MFIIYFLVESEKKIYSLFYMTEYYNKCIKYKNKYLSLKSQIGSAALASEELASEKQEKNCRGGNFFFRLRYIKKTNFFGFVRL